MHSWWTYNVSPLGVVDIVSSLSVVGMVYCRTASVTQRYTPDIVWIVGGGLKIKAHHPWELNTPLRGLELSPLGS
jgi:hypothetical protein